jgi:hypothetical protein
MKPNRFPYDNLSSMVYEVKHKKESNQVPRLIAHLTDIIPVFLTDTLGELMLSLELRQILIHNQKKVTYPIFILLAWYYQY